MQRAHVASRPAHAAHVGSSSRWSSASRATADVAISKRSSQRRDHDQRNTHDQLLARHRPGREGVRVPGQELTKLERGRTARLLPNGVLTVGAYPMATPERVDNGLGATRACIS
jgi:hypothetical protein